MILICVARYKYTPTRRIVPSMARKWALKIRMLHDRQNCFARMVLPISGATGGRFGSTLSPQGTQNYRFSFPRPISLYLGIFPLILCNSNRICVLCTKETLGLALGVGPYIMFTPSRCRWALKALFRDSEC